MTPRRSTLLFATLAIWSVAWTVWTADVFVEPVPFAFERAARRLPLCLAGVAMCMAFAACLVRLRRPAPRIAAAAAGVVLLSLGFAILNEVAFYLVLPRWGPPALIHVPDVAMMDGWVFLAWTLMFFALASDATRRDRELALAHSQAAALDAQHRLLASQAQPHFLFNALNAIYALVLDDEAVAARSAILTLSDYLRRSLADPGRTFTLAEELGVARDYLAIEQLRFGDRLRIVEAVPDDLLALALPGLVLQPLVENSVKHGLAERDRPLTITIGAVRIAGAVRISVSDDGNGVGVPGGPAIGIASIARRLDARLGPNARIEAGPCPAGGYVVAMTIPATA